MSLKRFYQRKLLEAGCDEAGRGCLAGPVFAAAVILDPKKPIKKLNDSKKLSEAERNALRPEIEENALAWAVASYSNQEIDKVNILKASFLSMHRALAKLSVKPELLLIDGNRFIPYPQTQHICIVKGDAKYQAIAAASILAKTHRDAFMEKIHQEFPQYNWQQNKGYPTLAHRAAIKEFGPCVHHRMTFNLLPAQISLF
ncbi:MAG: ribonuclease HII [Bacteroidetes bacterium]|nr:ribonuclease HII [Bacteroidota bacterium]